MIIFWLLAIVLFIIGFAITLMLNIEVTPALMPYAIVFLLVTLDCFFFAIFMITRNINSTWQIITRLLIQTFFGSLMIYFGNHSELDLHLVAFITIGVNLLISFHRVISPLFDPPPQN